MDRPLERLIVLACLAGAAAAAPLGAQQSSGSSMSGGGMSGGGMSAGMKGDAMKGDAMKGDAMKGDGMRGEAMGGMGHGGMAMGAAHAFTKGEVAVTGGYTITPAGDRQILAFTPDFTLGKAPSPYVVLSNTVGLGDHTVWLGEIRHRSGAQQFAIPAGTDLSLYTHVVLWCKTAKVVLASAELAPAGGMSKMSGMSSGMSSSMSSGTSH